MDTQQDARELGAAPTRLGAFPQCQRHGAAFPSMHREPRPGTAPPPRFLGLRDAADSPPSFLFQTLHVQDEQLVSELRVRRLGKGPRPPPVPSVLSGAARWAPLRLGGPVTPRGRDRRQRCGFAGPVVGAGRPSGARQDPAGAEGGRRSETAGRSVLGAPSFKSPGESGTAPRRKARRPGALSLGASPALPWLVL